MCFFFYPHIHFTFFPSPIGKCICVAINSNSFTNNFVSKQTQYEPFLVKIRLKKCIRGEIILSIHYYPYAMPFMNFITEIKKN